MRVAQSIAFSLALSALALAGFAQSSGKDAAQKKDQVTISAAGDADRGKVLYQRNCAICHHSSSTAKKIGPGLKAIYQRDKFADGKPVSDENLRAWIENGGKDMPQFKDTLKSAQILDLIAFLKTL